jgi:hypothetical protein
MLLATNQDYTLTRTRKHCPIEAANGSGAHNSNLVESSCHGKTMLTGESERLRNQTDSASESSGRFTGHSISLNR